MENRELIKKYYEMWNDKTFDQADKLLDQNINFRGSLDMTANGIEEFKAYAHMLTEAFPNLNHSVEISVFENTLAAVYVTYNGKHEGKIMGYEPTGKRISYSGAAFFHFKNGKIISINVLGDLNALHRQLSAS